MSTRLAAGLLVFGALALAGCDGPAGYDQERDREPAPESAPRHVHAAPHGGVLVVFEEESFNGELLRDPETGTLTLWLLDGHAANPVRAPQEAIELTLNVGGTAEALRLEAVADPLTGETKGDTSQFRGRSDSLRGSGSFSGLVRSVRLGARSYDNVRFEYAGPLK